MGSFHRNKPPYSHKLGASQYNLLHFRVPQESLQDFLYLVGLEKHVDNTWCPMAPVDKQVSGVIDTGREVARRELEAADKVHAGLDCIVQLYLAHSKARLGERKH